MASDPFKVLPHSKKARREELQGTPYLRLTDDVRDLPRGTVVMGAAAVYGYPHIGRILRLDTGLAQQFEAPFHVEEKIDGYNVRIARMEGRVLALTRGGFVCPFTTDRLADLLDLSLFDEQPDLVLCAEAAGPDQPYVVGHPPQVQADVGLFVFDLMRLNQPGFVPSAERGELSERYALPVVPGHGRFDTSQVQALRELLWELSAGGREGVVFKEDSPRARRAKYVTGASCIEDIRATVDNMLQLPPEYFTGRVLRLALFLREQGMREASAHCEALGHAFVDGLLEAVRQFEAEHRVFHTHRCRFRDPDNARLLLEHLRRAEGPIQIVERGLRREGGYHVLEFDKVYAAMTGLMGHLNGGELVFD